MTSSATNQFNNLDPTNYTSKLYIWEGKLKKHDNNKMQDQTHFIKHVKMMQTQQTHSKINARYTLYKHNL